MVPLCYREKQRVRRLRLGVERCECLAINKGHVSTCADLN